MMESVLMRHFVVIDQLICLFTWYEQAFGPIEKTEVYLKMEHS